jgi:hypothetical protein
LPERPDLPVRIEAAAYRGRPVSFQIIGPWTRAARMEAEPESTRDRVLTFIGTVVITVVIISTALAARYQLRRGRADRRGADRLALVIIAMFGIAWLLGGHHVDDVGSEINGLFLFLAVALLVAATNWLFYLALEPLVRKWDPRALVGWTRIMNGAFRDPHVGHDVLIGVVAGTLVALSRAARGMMPTLAGGAPNMPVITSFAPLVGPEQTLSMLAGGLPQAFINAMLLILAFAFLRMVTGRTWLSAAIVIALLTSVTALEVLPDRGRWMELLIAVPGVTMMLVVAIRFGLLTTIVMSYVWLCIEALPLTADPSMRYFASSVWLLAGIFALALFAAYAARAGQPLFKSSRVLEF